MLHIFDRRQDTLEQPSVLCFNATFLPTDGRPVTTNSSDRYQWMQLPVTDQVDARIRILLCIEEGRTTREFELYRVLPYSCANLVRIWNNLKRIHTLKEDSCPHVELLEFQPLPNVTYLLLAPKDQRRSKV